MQIKQVKYTFYLSWFVLAALLTGCDSREGTVEGQRDKRLSDSELNTLQDTNTITQHFLFGFDLRSGPQEDARQYLPFLKYLEEKTGYKFKLRFTPKDGKIVDDLGKGRIHFAAIGAVSYIQAAETYGVKPLARGLNTKGKAEYRSMIIVKPNSPLRKLTDLKGKNVAFGSITSTQGHLIPRIELSRNNLSLSDLASYEYTGSHQKCADAVISGRFDACGLQDTMAKELEQRGKVRILSRSDYYPSSGIAANKNIADDVLLKIKQAMLDFQPTGGDAARLYHWHKTEMPNGFVTAQDGDYLSLRSWLIKLGLLKSDSDSKK